MMSDITKYLLSITNASITDNLTRYLNNLMEMYNDNTIDIGVLNWLSQVHEVDGYTSKIEIQSLILTWQINILAKSGINVINVDLYSLDKLDIIIEMLSSIEYYDDKYSIITILNTVEDNKYIIANLASEITGRCDALTLLEIIDDVDDKVLTTISDYCQPTIDDVVTTPTPDLMRQQQLKSLVSDDPNSYTIIKEYIMDGYAIGTSLIYILSIIKNKLIELSIPEIVKNIQAAFLLSSSTADEATNIADAWANCVFVDRPDAVVTITSIDFGVLQNG